MASEWVRAGGVGFVLAVILRLAPTAFGQVPANSCASAPFVSIPGNYLGTTVGATADGTASCGTTGSSPDVWVRFIANRHGAVTADTCVSTVFDSIISVRAGCGGVEVACNDDSCGITSSVSFFVDAGLTYFVRVSGFSGEIGPFTLSLAYTDPPAAPSPGPDAIVGEINGVRRWGSVGGINAYSVGATVCNIGDEDVAWSSSSNRHPVIAQSIYRLANGRFEQVGQSWVRHASNASSDGLCGICNGHLGEVLGVGCSDPYSALLNADQATLGPRWQVNPSAGAFAYPPANPAYSSVIDRRIQVRIADIDPAQNAGASYFAEALLVTPDDSEAGHSLNNASHRRLAFAAPDSDPTLAGATERVHPAIMAWKDADPTVTEAVVDINENGRIARFIVAGKASPLASGMWRYEYAVYNQNSERACGSVSVPLSSRALLDNVGFHDVDYHSGDGLGGVNYSNADWAAGRGVSDVEWSTESYLDKPNANALRWGTLYNFRFDASVPPMTGRVVLGLFKPGDAGLPESVVANGLVVPRCRADWNGDATMNSQDFFDFVADFFALNADFNADTLFNSQDFFDFLSAFFEGC